MPQTTKQLYSSKQNVCMIVVKNRGTYRLNTEYYISYINPEFAK